MEGLMIAGSHEAARAFIYILQEQHHIMLWNVCARDRTQVVMNEGEFTVPMAGSAEPADSTTAFCEFATTILDLLLMVARCASELCR